MSVGCENGIKNQTKVFNLVVVGFGFEKQLFLLGIVVRMECSATDICNVCQTRGEMENAWLERWRAIDKRLEWMHIK